MFLTIIIFFLILGLLVFVHEFGHFMTAKKFGVRVDEFGFGLPPRLFGKKIKETIYSLNWIPLGGFVKIKGEQGESKEDPDSFAHKKIWQRGVILSSGVVMNYLLAMVLVSLGFIIGFPQSLPEEKNEKVEVKNRQIQIVSVLPNSPAEKQEIKMGDFILSLDGKTFKEIESLQKYIDQKVSHPVKVKIKRGSMLKELEITPIILKETQKGGIGVGLVEVGIVSYPWYLAISKGVKATLFYTSAIFVGFYHLLKGLVLTREVIVDLAGPVGIAVLTGEVVRLGSIYILQFTALLSLNLAIINFFPFPALDGGRFLFLMIEKIRGRALNQKIEGIIHQIGLTLLLFLVLLVTFRDIGRFSDKFIGLWEKIGTLF